MAFVLFWYGVGAVLVYRESCFDMVWVWCWYDFNIVPIGYLYGVDIGFVRDWYGLGMVLLCL